MSGERDELAGLIGRCLDRYLPGIPMDDCLRFMAATAAALRDAGWVAPALSFTEQEADRNARGVKPGEHLIAAADAADVGRAELDGLNQDQFTAVHALLRRLEREQPGIVTDAELSAICGLPPWWKPLRQREPGARPCCHTTGPHHHPACTTDRTEQQQ